MAIEEIVHNTICFCHPSCSSLCINLPGSHLHCLTHVLVGSKIVVLKLKCWFSNVCVCVCVFWWVDYVRCIHELLRNKTMQSHLPS